LRCRATGASPEAFRGRRWMWMVNLVFDNTVLLRKTVR
jgi:hypothetical protein